MKSLHLPSSPPADIPVLKVFPPITTFCIPSLYCLAASLIACCAEVINLTDSLGSIPGKPKSAPVSAL